MPDQYDEYEDDFDNNDGGPANLRKALKKAEKQRKELEEQLSSMKANLRDRSVKDVLETKGVNPKIAAFIPREMETPEQIATWLTEHADIFGFQMNQQQSSEQVMTEDQRTSQRIDNAVSTASSPVRDEDLMSRVKNASSKDELDQLIFGSSTGR